MRLKDIDAKKIKSYKNVVYETYKDFAENTSIHGLKYTVKKEVGKWERLFWIMMIFTGVSSAGYMTVLFWERYTSTPTRTTVKTFYAPTTIVPFPAITLCNNNRILLSKVDVFVNTLTLDKDEEAIVRRTIPQLIAFSYPNIVSYNISDLETFERVLDRNNVNTSSIMRQLGQTCEDMLIYCSWNKKSFNCLKFFKESLTAEGYCCSFNYVWNSTLELRYTGFSGVDSGLLLILNPMLQKVQYSSLFSSGFKVIIHDPLEYVGSQSSTRVVSVNRLSYIQIMGTKMLCSEDVKQLPISQRHCMNPEDASLQSISKHYSSSNCLTECDAEYYYTQCGCVPFYFQFYEKPICNITKIPCLHAAKNSKYETDTVSFTSYDEEMILDDTGTRKCNCMAQCEDDIYSIISAAAVFDRDKGEMSMLPYINKTNVDNSLILNVYFLQQTQRVYVKDTITSTLYLLSSFGGVYSLFIGCSLITLVEIIYYCFFRFMVNLKILHKVSNNDNNDVQKEEDTVYKISEKLPFQSSYVP